MAFEPYRHVCRTMPDEGNETDRNPSFISCTPRNFCQASIYRCEIYTCELCSETETEPLIGEENLRAHCEDDSHTKRVEQIRRLQMSRTKYGMARFLPLIDQWGLPKWRVDIRDKFFLILLYKDVKESSEVLEMQTEVFKQIAQYDRLDKSALLELVIWKAMCLITNPGDHGNYHAWQDWQRHGWKKHKKTMRDANEIGIVMTSVLPFMQAADKDTRAAADAN